MGSFIIIVAIISSSIIMHICSMFPKRFSGSELSFLRLLYFAAEMCGTLLAKCYE